MMQAVISIRASSLAELLDCPARWAAKNIDGLRLPGSAAATLGTAIHAGTAAYDASRLPGGTPITADDAAGAVVDAIHHPEDDVDWEDTRPQDAERVALALHTRYCAEIAPTRRYVGVEVRCDRLEIPDLGLALTGTTDRIRELPDGSIGIADLKSGARAVGTDGAAVTQGHGPQLGVYELIAEHAVGRAITAPAEIIGLNTGKTPAAQRVGTGEVHGARAALIGQDGQPGILEYASKIIHEGLFYGNPKSVLCSGRYCPAHPTCRWKG